MMPHPVVRLVPLALLGASAIALAQSAGPTTYKWVDENGRVTYSDQPPVGRVKSQETLKLQAPASPGAAQQVFNQDALFKKRQEDEAKKQADSARKEAVEAQKRDACTRARGELRALREGNLTVVKINEKGEQIVIDDSTRDSESKRIETFLEENCTATG